MITKDNDNEEFHDDTAWMVAQNKDGNLELVFVNVVEMKEPVGVETNDDGDENL